MQAVALSRRTLLMYCHLARPFTYFCPLWSVDATYTVQCTECTVYSKVKHVETYCTESFHSLVLLVCLRPWSVNFLSFCKHLYMYNTNHLCSTSERNWLICIYQYVYHERKKKAFDMFHTSCRQNIMCNRWGTDLDGLLFKMNGCFNPLEVKTNIFLGSFRIYVAGKQSMPL